MNALVFLLLAADSAPTLSEFLTAAQKNNVDRRLSVEQVSRASAELKQAWLALLPSITVQGSYTRNQFEAAPEIPTGEVDVSSGMPVPVSQRLVIQPYNALQASARFELPLINASLWARVGAASAAADATEVRDKLTDDVVRRNVVIAYYGYVAALAVRGSSQKTLAVAQELNKLAEIRRSVGAAVELDVLRARAEVERAHQSIADAASLVATSARALKTLTGLEPPTERGMPEDDMRPEPSFGELEQQLDGLPAVRSADLDSTASRRLKVSSYLALVPNVGAHFTETVTNITGFVGRNNYWTAGVFLTWRLDGPTFATMAQQSAIANAAEVQSEKARLQARDQIHSDWQRFTAARTKVQAAKAQVEAATKASQIASTRYNLGAATQLDFIQASRDAFFAEVSQIQARTDLAIARASLRISSGRSLD